MSERELDGALQEILDEFLAGLDVEYAELRKMYRDFGFCDQDAFEYRSHLEQFSYLARKTFEVKELKKTIDRLNTGS